jgi:hypothetical protein
MLALLPAFVIDFRRAPFRRRCPRCKYAMPDLDQVRCSECGFVGQKRWRYYTPRVRWFPLAVAILAVSALPLVPRVDDVAARGPVAGIPDWLLVRLPLTSNVLGAPVVPSTSTSSSLFRRELLYRIRASRLSSDHQIVLANRLGSAIRNPAIHKRNSNTHSEYLLEIQATCRDERVRNALQECSHLRMSTRTPWPMDGDRYVRLDAYNYGVTAGPRPDHDALLHVSSCAHMVPLTIDQRSTSIEVSYTYFPWNDGLVPIADCESCLPTSSRLLEFTWYRGPEGRTGKIYHDRLLLEGRTAATADTLVSPVVDGTLQRLLQELAPVVIADESQVHVDVPVPGSKVDTHLLEAQLTLALSIELAVGEVIVATGSAWWGPSCYAPKRHCEIHGSLVRLEYADSTSYSLLCDADVVSIRCAGSSAVALRHFCASQAWDGMATYECWGPHLRVR